MSIIKIAVSGAHSTGKTTYLNKLAEFLNSAEINYRIVGDLAINCPLPILHNHTIESTLWIASKGILKEIEAGNEANVVLVDRPIVDCWAYFNVVCKGKYHSSNPKLKTLNGMIKNWLPTYDFIYQTVINENIPIEDNKGRDLNPEYRRQIGNEMVNASKIFRVNAIPLKHDDKDKEIQTLIENILTSLDSANSKKHF